MVLHYYILHGTAWVGHCQNPQTLNPAACALCWHVCGGRLAYLVWSPWCGSAWLGHGMVWISVVRSRDGCGQVEWPGGWAGAACLHVYTYTGVCWLLYWMCTDVLDVY